MLSTKSLATAALIAVTSQARTEPKECTDPNPNVWSTICDHLASWDLSWEITPVTTDDGYHLQAVHILNEKTSTIPRPAMIWQHGMGGSAESYIFGKTAPDSKKPPALNMADEGFDVYFANNSGTKFSQTHVTLTVDDPEFWKFDWSKLGVYDFPALTRKIQETNGGKKVTMIGHSQGTTQTFAGMGLIPEWYDANVSSAIMMGPCTSPN